MRANANFLFEMGILAKTPRTAFPFLGSGDQSVAEHINRACYIGLVLAQLEGNVDMSKVILMCLLHDMLETRCSDLNYVHQQYVQVNEDKIIREISAPLPFSDLLQAALSEYRLRQTQEAILAKDADNLEWIMTLKEQLDLGNMRAKAMIENAQKRLKTAIAKELCSAVLETRSDAWYADSKDESWWVERKESSQV